MPLPRALLLAALLAQAPSAARAALEPAGLFDGRVPKGVALASPPPVEGPGGPAWTPADPDDEPGEGNPGSPERSGFWDRLQDKAFDQICKNIKLRARQAAPIEGYGGGGLQVERYMARTAAGTFALVDRTRLDLSASYGETVAQTEFGPLALSVGASAVGESVVVRPLGTRRSCSELGRLVNLFDYKVALPLAPERVAAMEVGELWKLPITLSLGVSAGAGGSVEGVPASLSIGWGKEGRSSVSLYRLSASELRLRWRIDRADLRSLGGSAVYSFPGAALGLPETEIVLVEQLVRLIDRQLARSVSRYLTARFGASRAKRSGREILFEFILDPRDERSVTALRELLRGDLNALDLLWELVSRAGRALVAEETDGRTEAGEVAGRHAERLSRAPSFVGVNDYERRGSAFNFRLPVLVDYARGSGRQRERLALLDEAGGEVEVFLADDRKDAGYFDVPLLGQIAKHNTQRTAQVLLPRGEGDAGESGRARGPVAVFVRQEGFLRLGAGVAREMVASADSVSRLIGVRGAGSNPATGLPVDGLFPRESLLAPERPPSREGGPPEEKSYHRGVSAFTLVLGAGAVRDILAAGAEEVVRAFMNASGPGDRELLERAGAALRVRPDGSLEYSDSEVTRALGYWSLHDDGARGALGELARISYQAACVVRDLARAREAASPEARAQALLEVLSGDASSGLAYEEILRVLVQLADPLDVAAEFFVNVEKRVEGDKDVASRLTLNRGLPDGAVVVEGSRRRTRFAEPSLLTD